MARSLEAPGATLLAAWRRLAPLPGGKWLFSRYTGLIVPYTGRLGSRVVTLEAGHAVVRLRERRAVRNHLRSVHAVALANMGEFTTGLAMLTSLSPGVRGILTGLQVDFEKKARGILVSECRVESNPLTLPETRTAVALIRDAAGDTVARVTARWNLRPPA